MIAGITPNTLLAAAFRPNAPYHVRRTGFVTGGSVTSPACEPCEAVQHQPVDTVELSVAARRAADWRDPTDEQRSDRDSDGFAHTGQSGTGQNYQPHAPAPIGSRLDLVA